LNPSDRERPHSFNAREQFLFMLDWVLALEQRHGHGLQAGLVHIAYDQNEIRDMTFSASDAAQKLNEVTECLVNVFRNTDIIVREGFSFWILVPFTKNDSVLEKVNRVIKTAPQNGLSIAQSNVRVFIIEDYLNEQSPKAKPAQEFLEFLLRQEHQSAAA
jgi:hypothetical protein